jgi:hypothetical protein
VIANCRVYVDHAEYNDINLEISLKYDMKKEIQLVKNNVTATN